MKRFTLTLLFVFCSLIFLPFLLSAQTANNVNAPTDWVGMMRDNTVNIHDVQNAFYTWYKNTHKSDIDKSKVESEEEDGSYELFKRWEWYNVPRADVKGNRFDQYKIGVDYQNFVHSNAASRSGPNISTGSWTYVGNTTVPASGFNGNAGDGRINRVRILPGNNNVMFACAATGGLWKTTNGGNSWSTVTDQLGDLSTSDIAINPLKTNVMYLATGDGDGLLGGNTTIGTIGILKSTDGGNTWNATSLAYTLSTSGAHEYTVNELRIDPTDTAVVLAATSFGIYRSTNSGATWTKTQAGWFHSIEFEPGHPSIVYASTSTFHTGDALFYRSTNNGVSFTHITVGLPTSNVGGFEIGVTAADTSVVYILADDSTYYGYDGLYLSNNHGVSFSTQSTYPNLLGWEQDGSDLGGQGWYTLSLAVSQTNADSVYVGGVNIWASSDGGVSWMPSSDWTAQFGPYVHADIHNIEFVPGSSRSIVTGCDGGVFMTSSSGGLWTDLSSNLEIGEQYSIGPSALTPGLWITGWQDNGTYLSSPSWSQVMGGDGMVCFIDWSNDYNLYAEYYNGNVQQSVDGGNSWNYIGYSLTESGPWVTKWLQDPQESNLVYGGFMNVWVYDNNLGYWNQLSTWGDSGITALTVDSSNDSYIYAAQWNTIEVTSDAGNTWNNITGTLPVDSASISAIAVSAANPLHVWVTFSGYSAANKVFYSNNGGSTWQNISTGLPNLPVNCIVSQSGSSQGGIYVGTDQGVYYRDTVLNSWIFYNTGLPLVMVGDLKIYNGSQLLAATYGRGTWETPLYSPPPAAPIAHFSVDSTSVCVGDAVTFIDKSANSPTSWSWTFTGGNPPTSIEQNPTVVYNTAGTYPVKLKVSNGLGSDSLTKGSYITVSANPTITVSNDTSVSSGQSVQLSATSNGSVTWSPATGLSCTNCNDPIADPSNTTTYTATATEGPCEVSSNVVVTIVTGINQLSTINDEVTIYPNPTTGDIFVNINSSVAELNDWNLLISDVLGRTVYSRQSLNYNNVIELSNLASGMYFITVLNNTGRVVVPVVKQ